MKNILLASCLIIGLAIACSDKPGGQKHQTTAASQMDTSLMWVDYCMGELPPPYYYAGTDTLVKKYKLRYQRIVAGCVAGPEEELLKAKYDLQNERYFKEIEKIYGKGWKKQFDAE
ncbi:MAG TPA: hypothetical protein VFR70_11160, partial [Flavobacterium sp.]|nr:hypothetical protein [Flavobacterium sp.]